MEIPPVSRALIESSIIGSGAGGIVDHYGRSNSLDNDLEELVREKVVLDSKSEEVEKLRKEKEELDRQEAEAKKKGEEITSNSRLIAEYNSKANTANRDCQTTSRDASNLRNKLWDVNECLNERDSTSEKCIKFLEDSK